MDAKITTMSKFQFGRQNKTEKKKTEYIANWNS